jgi:CBS domain-containing protein
MEPVNIAVSPHETVLAAARSLAGSRVGLVPVVDDRGCLRGVLTNASLISTLVEVLWPGEEERGSDSVDGVARHKVAG